MKPYVEDVRGLRARLLEQSFLFDEPDTYLAGVEDALAAVVHLLESAPDAVRARLSEASRGHDHLVEFYESDEFLVESVVQFLAPSLGAGEAAVIVASGQHRDQFEAALAAEGLDVTGALDRAQLLVLDADQTLASFMVDGSPDPVRFRGVMGDLIDRAAQSGGVPIYGEMVAQLWEEGNTVAALRLEDLWNELGASHSFALLCAYPMGAFDRQENSVAFRALCQRHTAVIPGESYSKLSGVDDRLVAVALLQHAARTGNHLRAALTRKQAELEAALGRLHDLDGRIEYVTMLVHDLRTPATIISESLGSLREGWSKLDDDEIHEFLTKANESIKQIERHVSDLMLVLWFSDLLLE